jgi:hypothetical protein
MNNFKNSKRDKFFENVIKANLESDSDNLIIRSKFNFSYMDFSQEAGQDFSDWGEEKIIKFLNKLIEYSKESLKYWQNQRVGAKNNTVLEVYGNFPKKSDFKHPTYIPHQVLWSRFRLEGSVRLIGFILPPDYHNKKHSQKDMHFDCNTFYVVFLDQDHRFYKTS